MGIIRNILFFMLFICLAHACKALAKSSSDSRCIESEWKALLEFKASFSQVNGSGSSSFWTGRDCCSWNGISCHNITGHVQTLRLNAGHKVQVQSDIMHLGLSPWLFNLTHLQVLTIYDLNLEGSIPDMFEKLTSLTYLDLSYNSFKPALFPDSLCTLTNLTHIDLSGTQLQDSLPSCLANLTSLATLRVVDNQLSGEIPGWLGHLSHLSTLDLSRNRFNSSIPFSLGNLTKLVTLDISDNFLTGELFELFFERLKSLKFLDISRNHHLVYNVSPKWIPPFQLLEIGMGSVFIGTQFPIWLQTQTNLQILGMGNTSISGAIPNWFPYIFPSLVGVDLSNNLLTGSILDCGCQTALPNLTYFLLSHNLLTGSIPNQCLTAFPQLFQIDLSYNSLTGSVPTFQCSYLLLSDNQFNGNIPQDLCNSTSLATLTLENNQLIGTIPSCVGALRMLDELNLGNNRLSGHIPHELSSLSLHTLQLNGNKLSGELPSSLQNMTSLLTLDLGENNLHGSLAPWIGKNWTDLQYIRLESNHFFGEIPLNLCQLPSLQILNLAINNLVGTIPPCIGKSSVMLSGEYDYGSYYPYDGTFLNTIKGRVLEYKIKNLRHAKFISLSSNHLQGGIPVELMNLKGLQSLDLSNNELTGIIPETINNLTQLESLDLSMNRLHGIIPQTLASIDALEYLNVSFNSLAGRIPSGNHFDTLDDPSIYQGNEGLCGKMLRKSCPGDDSPTYNQPDGIVSDVGKEFEFLWFSAGIGPGFAVGFLAVIFILYFKREWRIACFRFAEKVYNKMKRG